MNNYKQLKALFEQLSHLNYIKRIMKWDEAVMMPEGAGKARAEALGTLSGTSHTLLISKKTKRLLDAAKQDGHLSPWDAANLIWMEKKYNNAVVIPPRLIEELSIVSIESEQAWRKYRAENNWADFLPLVTWLRENIHSQASLLSTDELLRNVTGKSLDPTYFINHIKSTYM